MEKIADMIGNAILMIKSKRWQGDPSWYVIWDTLGYDDYLKIVAPWCRDNLNSYRYEASSTVHVDNEEDALLLYMRFK